MHMWVCIRCSCKPTSLAHSELSKNSCEFLSHSSCVWRNEGMHVNRPQTAESNRRWTQCDVALTRLLWHRSCIARRQLFWLFATLLRSRNQLQRSISHNAGLVWTCTNTFNYLAPVICFGMFVRYRHYGAKRNGIFESTDSVFECKGGTTRKLPRLTRCSDISMILVYFNLYLNKTKILIPLYWCTFEIAVRIVDDVRHQLFVHLNTHTHIQIHHHFDARMRLLVCACVCKY